MPSGAKAVLAILASGTGSNADKICQYFHAHPDIHVGLIITNRAEAGVLKVAEKHGIPSTYIPKKKWADPNEVLPHFDSTHITHVVLAGFLLLVPPYLIKAYPHRIINIHPALLPKHGGKGLYGHYVHASVKEAGDTISGITIHEVNEHYDEGEIIFQKEVSILPEDSPEEIGRKVLQLEHRYYPEVIESWVT